MMTQLQIIILSIFFLFSCSTNKNKKIVKIFPTGKTEKEIVYHNPHDTLSYTELTYFENGRVKSSIDFYKGRFNGQMVTYYENGKKKFEASTQMSSFIGIKNNYDENGNLFQTDSLFGKCGANDCCCDGMVTRFYPNGKISEKFTNKSGKINGEMVSFYENGQMESSRYFIDEKEDGISKYWSDKGKLTKEKTYNLGLADGATVEYYENYKVQGQYKNGKEEGEWMFIDTLGKVIQIEHYKNGEKKE